MHPPCCRRSVKGCRTVVGHEVRVVGGGAQGCAHSRGKGELSRLTGFSPLCPSQQVISRVLLRLAFPYIK